MLGNEKLMAFVGTANRGRATEFYRDTLGLALVDENLFAAVFDANGALYG
jgi:catechol 2,3-dioxygenase-like lactoylglutathione lyase family enzyme